MDAPARAGIGANVARIEGRLKVTGAARYPSDVTPPGAALCLPGDQPDRARADRLDR